MVEITTILKTGRIVRLPPHIVDLTFNLYICSKKKLQQ